MKPWTAVSAIPCLPTAVATPPCHPTTRWAPYSEAPDGPVRAGPQPGMSDVAHTTIKPTPTPACPFHHHHSRGFGQRAFMTGFRRHMVHPTCRAAGRSGQGRPGLQNIVPTATWRDTVEWARGRPRLHDTCRRGFLS